MIQYRIAKPSDVKSIAHLHAQSWSENYRGNFNDAFLDGPVFEERLKVWEDRFKTIDLSRHIILAVNENQLCGFVCLFLDQDPNWGSLIDNLHVSKDFKGLGIGKTLTDKAKSYIQKHSKTKQYHLFVLTDNKNAIAFYKRIGGQIQGSEIYDNPDGARSEVYRFVWNL